MAKDMCITTISEGDRSAPFFSLKYSFVKNRKSLFFLQFAIFETWTDKAKSIQCYKVCQVFVSDKGFVAFYPMKKASNFEDALKNQDKYLKD